MNTVAVASYILTTAPVFVVCLGVAEEACFRGPPRDGIGSAERVVGAGAGDVVTEVAGSEHRSRAPFVCILAKRCALTSLAPGKVHLNCHVPLRFFRSSIVHLD